MHDTSFGGNRRYGVSALTRHGVAQRVHEKWTQHHDGLFQRQTRVLIESLSGGERAGGRPEVLGAHLRAQVGDGRVERFESHPVRRRAELARRVRRRRRRARERRRRGVRRDGGCGNAGG